MDIVANNHPLVNYKCQGHPEPCVHWRFFFRVSCWQIMSGLGWSVWQTTALSCKMFDPCLYLLQCKFIQWDSWLAPLHIRVLCNRCSSGCHFLKVRVSGTELGPSWSQSMFVMVPVEVLHVVLPLFSQSRSAQRTGSVVFQTWKSTSRPQWLM